MAALLVLSGCSSEQKKAEAPAATSPPAYFKVDAATAGNVSGRVQFTGKLPKNAKVDMSEDPACVEASKGKTYEGALLVGKGGALANAFVYVKSGLEGKAFEPPAAPVTIDQSGCWFRPRVFGIQVGQPWQITNSDPVTHNIHPLAVVNREWNHSQANGDPPMTRKFTKPEVMVKIKCNIHSWMRSYVGVVDNPYFAVTAADGSYSIGNLPPGEYTLAVWQETLGTKEQKVTVPPSGKVTSDFAWTGGAE